jgi:hypothetical protein
LKSLLNFELPVETPPPGGAAAEDHTRQLRTTLGEQAAAAAAAAAVAAAQLQQLAASVEALQAELHEVRPRRSQRRGGAASRRFPAQFARVSFLN